MAKRLADVIVATDDQRIADALADVCRVEMTCEDHPSGTDRVAEVVRRCELGAVVNVQGDEPMIDPGVIDAVAARLDDSEMSTAAVPIRQPEEWGDSNAVKVVVNASGQALYFSRRTIPYLRDAADAPGTEQLAAFPFLKHLGIYGYRRETLLRLVECPVSPLEEAEKLEQLRALDNGIPIAVAVVDHDSVGIDTPENLEQVRKKFKTES